MSNHDHEPITLEEVMKAIGLVLMASFILPGLLSLVFSTKAHAQMTETPYPYTSQNNTNQGTVAARPVEQFSYGVRQGTSKNPLVAILSTLAPSAYAQSGPYTAASPVELFSYGVRVGTSSNPLTIACNGCLTQAQANSQYLELSGGNAMTGPLAPASYTFANLPTNAPNPSEVYCSDCQVKDAAGNTDTGVMVLWNGTNWMALQYAGVAAK